MIIRLPQVIPNPFMEGFEPTGNTFVASIASYADLLTAAHPLDEGVILTHDATYTNICPGGWIVDPLDATKFLLYVGEFIGNSLTGARVALYEGLLSDPRTLNRVGVVLTDSASGFDSKGVGFGGVVNVAGTVYYYYAAYADTTNIESIGVATSTDGGRTFTKQGQAIAPDGTNETGLSFPAVLYEGGTWYLYPTKKTGTPGVNIIPVGVIIASSTDGITFTKTGVTAVALGGANSYDTKYIEGGQIVKIGSDYVFIYTACSTPDIWSINASVASSANSAFTKWTGNPFIEHRADSEAAAVSMLVNPSGNNWFCYYQTSNQQQPASIWDIAFCWMNYQQLYPAGILDKKNGWSSSQPDVWDISTEVTLSGTRALRGLKNTGVVSISHSINVSVGATSYVKVSMRMNTATGAFRGGFYVMEGATIITGVYFDVGNLKDLRSGAVWTTLQAYTMNTWYTIEVFLPNATTHTIKINGSTIVTGVSNYNNVSVKADGIKLEKTNTQTTQIYFDEIKCSNT